MIFLISTLPLILLIKITCASLSQTNGPVIATYPSYRTVFGDNIDLTRYMLEYLDICDIKSAALTSKSSLELIKGADEAKYKFESNYKAEIPSYFIPGIRDYIWFSRSNNDECRYMGFVALSLKACSAGVELNSRTAIASGMTNLLLQTPAHFKSNGIKETFPDFLIKHRFYQHIFELIHGLPESKSKLDFLGRLPRKKLKKFVSSITNNQIFLIFAKIVACPNSSLFELILPIVFSQLSTLLTDNIVLSEFQIELIILHVPEVCDKTVVFEFKKHLIDTKYAQINRDGADRLRKINYYLYYDNYESGKLLELLRFSPYNTISFARLLDIAAINKKDAAVLLMILKAFDHFNDYYYNHFIGVMEKIFENPDIIRTMTLRKIHVYAPKFFRKFCDKFLNVSAPDDTEINQIILEDFLLTHEDLKLAPLHAEHFRIRLLFILKDESYPLSVLDIIAKTLTKEEVETCILIVNILLTESKPKIIKNFMRSLNFDLVVCVLRQVPEIYNHEFDFRKFEVKDLIKLIRNEALVNLFLPFKSRIAGQENFRSLVYHLENVEEALIFVRFFEACSMNTLFPDNGRIYATSNYDLVQQALGRNLPEWLHILDGKHLVVAFRDKLDEVKQVVRQWIYLGKEGNLANLEYNMRNCNDLIGAYEIIIDSVLFDVAKFIENSSYLFLRSSSPRFTLNFDMDRIFSELKSLSPEEFYSKSTTLFQNDSGFSKQFAFKYHEYLNNKF